MNSKPEKLHIPTVPKRKLTLLNALAYTVFGGALIIVVDLFYIFFYPFNPLIIKNVHLTSGSVVAGNSIYYDITSCKNTNDTPTVYRKIVSPTVAESLMTSAGVLSKGCSNKIVPILVPAGTPPGQYTLYTEVIYHINALRNIQVYWHVGPFEVIQ